MLSASEIISAALISASACWLALLSLPRVGVIYKPKFFPCIVIFSFIHSVPCQPLKVLVAPRLLFSGTLERDLVGLVTECVFCGTLPRMALSSSFSLGNAACRCSVKPKWNANCTGSRQGAAMRPGDHTWWAHHVLHYSALDSPVDELSEAFLRPRVLCVGQPVWALTQDPQRHPHFFCSQTSQSSFIVTSCSVL